MPPLKHHEANADVADPTFNNMTEVYLKTGTKSEDWEPVRTDIKEFLIKNDIGDFKKNKDREAESELINKIGRTYQDHEPPLFKGLNEDGIESAISTLIRRVAYNIRRRDKEIEQRSPSEISDQKFKEDDAKSERSISTFTRDVPDRRPLGFPPSMDLAKANIRVKFANTAIRLPLADIGSAADAPLSLEDTVTKITLPTFAQCIGEDLGLDPTKVEVWFKFNGSGEPGKLRNDRQLRGAVQEVITGENGDPVFHVQLVGHDQTSDSHSPPKATYAPHTPNASDMNTESSTWKRRKSESPLLRSPEELHNQFDETPSWKRLKSTSGGDQASVSIVATHASPSSKGTGTRLFSRQRQGGALQRTLPINTATGFLGSTLATDQMMEDAPPDISVSKFKANRAPVLANSSTANTIASDKPNDGDIEMANTDQKQDMPASTTTDDLNANDSPPMGEKQLSLKEPYGLHPGKPDQTTPPTLETKTDTPASHEVQSTDPPEEKANTTTASQNRPATARSSNAVETSHHSQQDRIQGRVEVDLTMVDDNHEADGAESSHTPEVNPSAATIPTNSTEDALVQRLRQGFEDAKTKGQEKTNNREGLKKAILEAIAVEDTVEELPGEMDMSLSEEERAQNRLKDIWPASVTEHITGKGNRWPDCCTMLLLDAEKSKETGVTSQIPGMKTELHPYQTLGTFSVLENESLQGGGYLGDGMGLGKTLQALAAAAANRTLVLNKKDVAEARKAGEFDRHLPKGTRKDPQPLEAECPSKNPWGIQCTCIDSGVSARLTPSYGPTLIFAPPIMLAPWLAQARRHMDFKRHGYDWKMRVAYGDSKLKQYAPQLVNEDYDLVSISGTAPYFHEGHDRSMVIVFTTSGAKAGQVDKKLAIHHPVVPKKGRTAAKAAWDEIRPMGWGRIIVDEAHTESNQGSGTIAIIRRIDSEMPGQKPRKTLLTGTPFETSPRQMAAWIGLIQDDRWYSPSEVEGSPRCTAQLKRLKECTADKIIDLGKKHEALVKGIMKEVQDKEGIASHKTQMSKVVQTLWVRRTNDSLFFGRELVIVPPNYHFDCLLEYPAKYTAMLKQRSSEAYAKAKHAYDAAKARYQSGQGTQKPAFSASAWLTAAREIRIISSFPELAMLPITKGLKLTLEEMVDSVWLRTEPKKLYELQRVGSPYERAVRRLAGPTWCPKMHALGLLREYIWGEEEKIVIMAMSPVSALIIYWAIRLIWKRPVALITSTIPKSRVTEIIKLFQEGKDGPKSDYPDESPQFIVGTTSILNTGITLTKAKHLVIFDSEWLQTTELQAIFRINRIGQDMDTETIKLVNKGCDVDMAIHDRQGARRQLFKSVEAPMTDSENHELRNIEEENAFREENWDSEGNRWVNGKIVAWSA